MFDIVRRINTAFFSAEKFQRFDFSRLKKLDPIRGIIQRFLKNFKSITNFFIDSI